MHGNNGGAEATLATTKIIVAWKEWGTMVVKFIETMVTTIMVSIMKVSILVS